LAKKTARTLGDNPGIAFLLKAAFWVIVLFALVRIGWVQQHVLLPFAGFQGRVACALAGTSPDSVFVGLSCTGADPMALVVGAVLAFPVSWRQRLTGCALGLAVILILNTVRIGTLSLVVDRRELFQLLHVYVWPAVLIVAAAGYVFSWMGRSLRAPEGARTSRPATLPFGELSTFSRKATLRFLGLTSLFVLVFYLGYRTWMSSAVVLEVARWATAIAGFVMALFGLPAQVTQNSLKTAHGVWIVTQSCVVTPLLPVYLAGALVLPATVGRRIVAALATLPLFLLLGSVRLLVLAVPAALVGSHVTAVHAFYQTLAAALVVAWLALRTRRGETPWTRTTACLQSLAAGIACALAVGMIGRAWLWPAAERLRATAHLGHAWIDGQGALALLPAFQLGLWVSLWFALQRSFRDRAFLHGLAVLAATQAVLLIGLGELAVHASVAVPVTVIRAISLVVPIGLALWLPRWVVGPS